MGARECWMVKDRSHRKDSPVQPCWPQATRTSPVSELPHSQAGFWHPQTVHRLGPKWLILTQIGLRFPVCSRSSYFLPIESHFSGSDFTLWTWHSALLRMVTFSHLLTGDVMTIILFTIDVIIFIMLSLTQGLDPASETSLITWGTLPLWLWHPMLRTPLAQKPTAPIHFFLIPDPAPTGFYSSLSPLQAMWYKPHILSHPMLRSLVNFYRKVLSREENMGDYN